jgi:hypothetical protein
MRILTQELPDLELRLKRYEGLKFRGQNQYFKKIQGYNWKFGKLWRLICEYRMCGGLLCKKIGARI